MQNTLPSVQAVSVSDKYHLTTTIYAVGIDPAVSTKNRVMQLHGSHSDTANALSELEAFISASDFKRNIWYLRFFYRVRRIMGIINNVANEHVKTQMAQDFIDELINGGYVRCVKCMAMPSGDDFVEFARSYAASHDMSVAAALLFGPSGGARTELRHFLAAERSHGQHRPAVLPRLLSDDSQQQWIAAGRTVNWPITNGRQDPIDVSTSEGKLPDDSTDMLSKLWRCNGALRDYTGSKRLSGDMPFKIIEDAVDIMMHDPLTPIPIQSRYDQIVRDANQQGSDSFFMVYKQLFDNMDQIQPYWDRAREMLYNFSIKLWEQQNRQWIANGTRIAADGVTFRARKSSSRRPLKRSVPGTIYLNNGRYYWVVRNKMKTVPLIDDRNRRKLPGTIGNDHGRYFWVVPGVLKRQRLVAEGQRFSTTDRLEAYRIAMAIWNNIQINMPGLAARIKARRGWGLATTDKTVALRVARKMWRDIQRNDPALAELILTDNRPEPSEHWIAQICEYGKLRHLGSFKSRLQAQQAYSNEFERIYGYPPGYNVQSMPKLDKVWPSWQEQKRRLQAIDIKPVMPVIGFTDKAKSLLPLINRMRKVDWLVHNCMLVFDDNAPYASPDITVESRGQIWYGEVKRQVKSPVIYGSTAFDRDCNRIRITLFGPAFSNAAILAEEVYHLVYRIISYTRPLLAKRIKTWHYNNVQTGLDPTLSEDEAFARTMANTDADNAARPIPVSVFNHASKLFSDSCRVPQSVLNNIIRQSSPTAIPPM